MVFAALCLHWRQGLAWICLLFPVLSASGIAVSPSGITTVAAKQAGTVKSWYDDKGWACLPFALRLFFSTCFGLAGRCDVYHALPTAGYVKCVHVELRHCVKHVSEQSCASCPQTWSVIDGCLHVLSAHCRAHRPIVAPRLREISRGAGEGYRLGRRLGQSSCATRCLATLSKVGSGSGSGDRSIHARDAPFVASTALRSPGSPRCSTMSLSDPSTWRNATANTGHETNTASVSQARLEQPQGLPAIGHARLHLTPA